MSTTLLIILLSFFALLLGLLEVFVIPGFGLAGSAAIICGIADVAVIYINYGLMPALGAATLAILLFGVSLYIVMRSKAIDRMALKSSINSTNATSEQLSVKVGEEGKALPRLALVGNAIINGKQVEVKSSGDFIDPGTPIVVTAVSEASITVSIKQ